MGIQHRVPVDGPGVEHHQDLVEAHAGRLAPDDHGDPHDVAAAVAAATSTVPLRREQADGLPVPQHVRREREALRHISYGPGWFVVA